MNRACPPRRLLLLLPSAFGEIGGIQLYNRLLIKAFSDLAGELAMECEIVILKDAPEAVDRRYLSPAISLTACGGLKMQFLLVVMRAVFRFRPDFVILGHVNMVPLAFAARLLGARSCLFVYGIEFWRTLPALGRLSLRSVDRIISISDFTAREGARLNRIAAERFRTIPCALDPFWELQFQSALKSTDRKQPILLTVARLTATEKYKGVEHAIRAIPAIAQQVPAVQYWIIGDGGDRPRLESVAREIGVADRVRFLGQVGISDLAAAYRCASVFVLPSAKEGFGIVFIEAAFFSVPSIGARSGGIPEVINEATGILVDYGNIAQISSAAVELLLSPAKRDRLGASARQCLQDHFSFDQLRGRLRELLTAATP